MIEAKDAENKLLLLYLVSRMELPMSRSQIAELVSQAEFMDYFTLQQLLADMADNGLLDSTLENTEDNNTTRFAVTDEGLTTLDYFEHHIPSSTRQTINRFVNDYRPKIKKDYEKTAAYFPDLENDAFRVKCGVYEDKRALLELVISVDTREQARLIQNNWKANAKTLYGEIIETLARG